MFRPSANESRGRQMRYLTSGVLISAFVMLGACFLLRGKPSSDTIDAIQIVEGRVVQPFTRSTARDIQQPRLPRTVTSTQRSNAVTSPIPDSSRGEISNEPEVDDEQRDVEWAVPTEDEIQDMMARIPYVDMPTVTVLCRETVCLATGKLRADLSDANRQLANQTIVKEDFYAGSTDINFIPKRSLTTTDNNHTFRIDFARIHK